MEQLGEILESQLEDAFELKSKKSLHNYISILVNNILERDEVNKRFLQLESDIKLLSETVKIGFENVNKRFEDINKRLDDTNKKINILIWIISLWMTLFTGLAVFLKLYQ